MSKDVSKYLAYKSSDIDWLGAVPKYWEITRLKYFLTEPLKYGANEAAELEDYDSPRYIRITDIKDDGTLKDETYKSLEFEVAKPYLLKDGDVLLARSGATVGKTFQYRPEWGVSAYAGYLIRARFVNQKIADWFYYFSKSKAYWDWLKSTFIQATIQNVSAEKYSNLFFSVPPQEEIDQILSFLDYQTTRIDRLIQKKKTLLDLLDEQRQAIITNAVTKGINPDASLKDSGIDWLGEVPEHWDVEKLKYFVQLNNREIEFDDDEEIVKIALENIESGTGKLIFEEDSMSFQGKGNPFAYGDILFNKLRPYLAKVIHAEFNGIAVGELLVLTPDKLALDSKFLFYRLLSDQFIKIVNNSTYGAKMPRANWDFIGNLRIGIPPLNEQLEIGTFLDQRIKQFDQIKSKIQTAIDRLEEYRSSLITQAVTGKIDVRDTDEVEMSYAAEEGELYKANE